MMYIYCVLLSWNVCFYIKQSLNKSYYIACLILKKCKMFWNSQKKCIFALLYKG